MKAITAGMTGAEYLTAINNVGKVYNVKDYGALGNGSDDDTVAVQLAINTCITAGGGVVFFPNGIYIIGGALQTNIGGLNPNSQLYIPSKIYTDADRCAISFIGESVVSGLPIGGSVADAIATYASGAIIKSTLTSSSGTKPSVIGVVPESYPVLGFPWVAVETEFKNLTIMVDALEGTTGPCLTGINGSILHSLRVDGVAVTVDIQGSATIVPSLDVTGIIIGLCNTSLPNYVVNSGIAGFKNGIISGEHVYLNNDFVYCCETAYVFAAGNYSTVAGKLSGHWCKYYIGFLASALYGGNLNAQVSIQLLTVETLTGVQWFATTAVVNDAGNKIYGVLNHLVCESGTAGPDNTKFTKTGGANLRCYPIFLPTATFTVTGARDETEGALANLLTALEAMGIIVDSSTAS